MKTSILCLPAIASLASAATPIKGQLSKDNLPSSGKDWVTLDNGIEFQAGENVDPRVEHVRKLWGSNKEGDNAVFVDGTETYYDDYAQAWRLLGFYIDCDHCTNDENDEQYDEAYCIQQGQEPICQRFLLWAAYVDLDYSGNGAGEYMYYDRQNMKWNNAACKESESARCVRMNCHEPTSHYELLGVFKEPDYGTFLEQLTKNQGDCVWTDEEYKFMQYGSASWPQQCTHVEEALYYDTKPETGGGIGIGLYTDYQCSIGYEGDITVAEVMAQMSDNDDGSNTMGTFDEDLAAWNDAFDAFKLCQPCKTSNIVSLINKDEEVNADGDRYQHMDNADDDYVFSCQDGSSYAAVNQCALFQSNTNMMTANYRDIMRADEQGTVGSVSMAGVSYGESENQKNRKWQRNFLSALFMMASFCLCVCSLVRCQNETENSDLSSPLMSRRNNNSDNKRQNRRNTSRNSS